MATFHRAIERSEILEPDDPDGMVCCNVGIGFFRSRSDVWKAGMVQSSPRTLRQNAIGPKRARI